VNGCATGDCGPLDCPVRSDGPCTTDGNAGSPCDSEHQTDCKTC
jgi:hypothetical protein